jgi:rhodanese-related sulfurtransferase
MMTVLDSSIAEADHAGPRKVAYDEALALHGRADVAFIDIRAWAQQDREGWIAGALRCPADRLATWLDIRNPDRQRLLGNRRILVIYGRSPSSLVKAARVAQDAGFDAVLMEGTLSGWASHGGPIARPAGEPFLSRVPVRQLSGRHNVGAVKRARHAVRVFAAQFRRLARAV